MTKRYRAIIAPQALKQHLGDPGWVIFDCRFSLADSTYGHAAYQKDHIPGAHYADLDRDLASAIKPGSGRHPLPDAVDLAAWLGACGVDGRQQVIAYDDREGAIAARLWWLLRWMGHDRVAVLDGGFGVWQQLGFPVTDEISNVRGVWFQGSPQDNLWVNADQVQRILERGRGVVIDARARARFIGADEPTDPVAGHIPGATNLPFSENVDDNGQFLAKPRLAEHFKKVLGERAPNQAIHMCGSGVTACHNLVAMEHAGMSGSRLYVGSWSQWITDTRRAVAKGD
ncbi:MAG: sulfurtransferase [Gammaproteobacteria bacterium]|nr:sulfurtransferase [Gammaproteobacteria bacterium]